MKMYTNDEILAVVIDVVEDIESDNDIMNSVIENKVIDKLSVDNTEDAQELLSTYPSGNKQAFEDAELVSYERITPNETVEIANRLIKQDVRDYMDAGILVALCPDLHELINNSYKQTILANLRDKQATGK